MTDMKLTNTQPFLEPAYMPGEKVFIDGEVEAYITELSVVSGPVIKYKGEWFQQGRLESGWFDAYRLEMR